MFRPLAAQSIQRVVDWREQQTRKTERVTLARPLWIWPVRLYCAYQNQNGGPSSAIEGKCGV